MSMTTTGDKPFICRKCHLRSLSAADTINIESVIVETDDKMYPEYRCSLCLGILQNLLKLGEDVTRKLIDQEYDPSNYSVSVSIPHEVYLREKIIELKDSSGFKLEVKDVVRASLERDISRLPEDWSQFKAITLSDHKQSSCIIIDIILTYQPNDEEFNRFKNILFSSSTGKRKRDSGFKKKSKEQVLKSLLDNDIQDTLKALYPPQSPINEIIVKDIILKRNVTFLTGRYLKYSREISQTAWYINGIRKGKGSVEEIVFESFKDLFKAEGFKFSGGGREDIDVRMLGNGRPFILQLINAKKAYFNIQSNDLLQIEKKLEQSKSPVQIRNVEISDSNCLKGREIEEKHKKKHYIAVIWCKNNITTEQLNKLNKITNLKVEQKTPIRVLHRRSLLVRDKMIFNLTSCLINDNHFVLRICSSAGTYIKEFVHGDLGRTKPSISSILECECDILQLDVEKVEAHNENTTDVK